MVNIDPGKALASVIASGPVSGEGLRFSQGVIKSWNPATFENQIQWKKTPQGGGIILTNVQVQSGAEALTYQPGDVVAMQGWSPGGGFGTWWITGRIITPGVGAAEQQIAFLQSELGRQVALEVISETVDSDTVATEQGLNEPAGNDSGFVDLATVGPQVTFSTETGRWVIIMTANGEIPGDGGAARMGYSSTGAQTVSADLSRSTLLGAAQAITTAGFGTHVFARTHTGNSGEITVTAKYRVIASASFPVAANWSNRFMMVISY